ncbi:MAG TPA: hypothetical protein VL981_06690 [Candidatus Methylacidiphilales bacterium]|nr:hypothetical protein [Candidatus Methylacidiphilales bacterium]
MKRKIFPLILAGIASWSGTSQADMAALPGNGFASSRYEALWTKSPFAVASSDMPDKSFEYALVGIAQIDGVCYASLIDKSNSNHFLLATNDKVVQGLRLISVTPRPDVGKTEATFQKDDQVFTLSLNQEFVNGPGVAGGSAGPTHLLTHIVAPQHFIQPANSCP